MRVPVDGRELRDNADAVGRAQDGVQRGDGAAGGEEEVGVVRLFGGQGVGRVCGIVRGVDGDFWPSDRSCVCSSGETAEEGCDTRWVRLEDIS